jgi:hypothetical protein
MMMERGLHTLRIHANLCAQEQRMILKGFLLGLKAAAKLK